MKALRNAGLATAGKIGLLGVLGAYSFLYVRLLVASVHGPADAAQAGLLGAGAVAFARLAKSGVMPLLVTLTPVLAGCELLGLLTVPGLALVTGPILLVTLIRQLPGLDDRLKDGLRNGADPFFALALLFSLMAVISCWTHLPAAPWRDAAFWESQRFGYASAYYPLEACQGWLTLVLIAFSTALAENWSEVAKPVAWATAGVVAGLALFVALQYLTGVPAPYPNGTRWGAPFAPARDIHSLGMVSAWASVTLAWIAVSEPASRVKRFALAGLGAALCLLSWSRAAWLALALGLGLLLFIHLRRGLKIGICALVLSGLVVVNLLPGVTSRGFPPYLERFWDLARLRDLSTRDSDRIYLWKRGAGMLRSHPLGVGLGRFYAESVRYADPQDPQADVPNFAHDIFLQTTAELGALGGTAWLFLVCLPLVPMAARITGHGDRLARFVPAAGLLTLLITQLTANALAIYLDQQLYFGWALGAAAVAARRTQRPAHILSRPCALI